MNKLIRNLSPVIEFTIVLIIGFGLFIFNSTYYYFYANSNFSHAWIYKLTNQGNYFLTVYEIIGLSLIIYILKVRGWTAKDFNLKFTLKLVGTAILLMFITNILCNIVYKLLIQTNIIDETSSRNFQIKLESSWISIILFVLINSIYEEFLLIGYIFKRLEKLYPIFIIGLSVFLRALYHTYQGWIALISIIILGAIFGYYYYKYKKLWPVIIAHGFMNLISFLNMHFHWNEMIKR
jgi:membrane protease YdiL (CAAX protease family)